MQTHPQHKYALYYGSAVLLKKPQYATCDRQQNGWEKVVAAAVEAAAGKQHNLTPKQSTCCMP
jgi:hypothetical protein